MFFQFRPTQPIIYFIKNRKEMDLIWGKKTEKWFVGAAKNNNIYIFHPKVFNKVSVYRKEKFWEVLKHEFCHIYYSQITKNNYPVWLNEGLASYISGKNIYINEKGKIKLLSVFKYFDKMDRDGYLISQFWTERLLQKFGQKKLVQLIKNINWDVDSKKFATLFYQVYGIEYNKKGFKKILNSAKE